MFDEIERDEVTTMIDRMVDELLHTAGVTAPPVDAIDLAQRHLGMTVCLDKQQAQRGRAQRTSGRSHIYLRPEPTEERHQWTVAHEIGEHLKAELMQRLGIEPGQAKAMTGESLANLFAYRLLVPSCWFAGDARAMEYDLLTLKRRYKTSSHEVLAWRLLDLPEPCVITIFDNDTISRRRSNGPRVTRDLLAVEKKCQQLVHRTGLAKTARNDGVTVRGWPVHMLDWKREILQTALEDA